jgi:hypothetical protein
VKDKQGHVGEDTLVLYVLGEDADRDAIGQHLADCAACRMEHQQIAAAVAAATRLPVPERSASYGDDVWARVRPAIVGGPARVASRTERFGWLFRPRALAFAGCVSAVIALVVVGARQSPLVTEPPQPTLATTASSDGARERVLLASLDDHFDRSQRVLLELTNEGTDGSPFTAREWAEDLLASNRLYRQTAEGAGERRFVAVLDDLERVLLEIAHQPEATPRVQTASFEQADARDMVFKLRVAQANVRARENEGRP